MNNSQEDFIHPEVKAGEIFFRNFNSDQFQKLT